MRYFIGNWKMFGLPKSINILKKINTFYTKDRNKGKYRIIITPPYTLLESYAKYFKKKNISIGSQNSYQKDEFSSNTAAVSPYMIKSVGAKYALIGHSDNRSEGDTNEMLKDKVKFALKNNLKVIFCIGETFGQKRKKLTKKILLNQLRKGLKKIKNKKNIIIAYEPVWSIGSGMIPKIQDLENTTKMIKLFLSNKMKYKNPKVIYGGSVNQNNINLLKNITNLDGFLIGGASQNSKKFIDIINKSFN